MLLAGAGGIAPARVVTLGLKVAAFAAEAPGAAIGTSADGIKLRFGMIGGCVFFVDLASVELFPAVVLVLEDVLVVLLLLDPEPELPDPDPEFVVPPDPEDVPPEPVPTPPPRVTVVATVPFGNAPGASVETAPSTETVFALMYV